MKLWLHNMQPKRPGNPSFSHPSCIQLYSTTCFHSSNPPYPSRKTECRNLVVNSPASYSGGPGFNSRPGDRLCSLRFFLVVLSPPGKCWDSTLKLVPNLFLPHPVYLNIHTFIRRYIDVSHWTDFSNKLQKINKQTNNPSIYPNI
jgi:hypothetical protein